MGKYYLGKNKEIVANSQLEARKIGYRLMKSSKYIYDYVRIYDSAGKLYGEVTKSGKWIDFNVYTKYKVYLYPLKENGEFKKPDSKRPYFYDYGNRIYRFETPAEARKSALRLNIKSTFDLNIYKETKNGYYLYQKLEIKGKGEVFCYQKEKFGFGLYKVGKNGELKKWK